MKENVMRHRSIDRTCDTRSGSESFKAAGKLANANRDCMGSIGFHEFEGEISLDGASRCGWSDDLRCEITIDVTFRNFEDD